MEALFQESSEEEEEPDPLSPRKNMASFIKKTFDPIMDNRSLNASPLLKRPQSSSSSSKHSSESNNEQAKRLESPNPVKLRALDQDEIEEANKASSSKKLTNAKSALSFMLRTQSLKSSKKIQPMSGSIFSRLLGKNSESETASMVQTNLKDTQKNTLVESAFLSGRPASGKTVNQSDIKDLASTTAVTRIERPISGFAIGKADPNTTRIETVETQETRRIEQILEKELDDYAQIRRPASAPILKGAPRRNPKGSLKIHTDRQQVLKVLAHGQSSSGRSTKPNSPFKVTHKPSPSNSEISHSAEKQPSALSKFFLEANPVFLKERYGKPLPDTPPTAAAPNTRTNKHPQKVVFNKTMRDVPIDVDVDHDLPSRRDYIQKGEFSFMMHDYFGRQVQKSIYNPKRSKYQHGRRGTSLLFTAFDTGLKQSADQSMATNVSNPNDEPEYVKIREEEKRIQREDRLALKNYLSSADPKTGLPRTSAPAYLQMADVKPKLDRVLKISRADSQSTLFIRKHLRTQTATANPLPTEGELPRSRYSLLLVEGAVQKKQTMKSREEQRRRDRETEYLEKLGGKYTAVPEILTPAKRLQTLIYEHRYVCLGLSRNYAYSKPTLTGEAWIRITLHRTQSKPENRCWKLKQSRRLRPRITKKLSR